MMRGDVCVLAVAALEAMAAISYGYDGDYLQALVWAGPALSNVCYVLLMGRG